MRAMKIVFAPDGTYKLFAEGQDGYNARELKETLEKQGKVIEKHHGPHKHAAGQQEHVHH